MANLSEVRYTPVGIGLSMAASAVLGCTAVIVAVAGQPLQRYEAPLFPVLRTAWEGANAKTLIFLFLAGLIVGVFRRSPSLLIGVSAMALFPLASVAEMVADPKSHNLFPIEWFLYGLATIPAIAGAALGHQLRKLL